MGYYTNYKLWSPNQEVLDNLMTQHCDTNEMLDYFQKYNDGSYSHNCKWYEHEEDMCKYSKQYPEALFILDGSGEEPGDIWRKYFKNGLICDAVISFSDFNPKYLRTPKVI